ncbi:MAG TPA: hypothetical protein GX740_00210 [Acholeplasmataceae bacterium]|nr:hypothetical protein [Acholeplasmataceae bacterium]
MSKALSFMVIGAIGAATAILYMQYKDDIRYRMHQIKQAGMETINKVKATME